MNDDVLSLDRRSIRGADSNTLLRMFDLATVIINQSPLQMQRAKADKAIQRIAEELRKRNVSL